MHHHMHLPLHCKSSHSPSRDTDFSATAMSTFDFDCVARPVKYGAFDRAKFIIDLR